MNKPNKKNFFGSNGRFQKQRFNYVKAVYRNYLKNKKQTVDPKYGAWLHAITILGYNEKIMIPTENKKIIDGYYEDGQTPESAFNLYKEYLKEKQ